MAGAFGVQEYAISDGSGVTKVDTRMAPLPRLSRHAGHAWDDGLFRTAGNRQPKEGETLVVSAAAGAVGSVVGQIGKIKGCRVVGIAGGPEKCQYVVKELGFDAAIDYKKEDVFGALNKHCPSGSTFILTTSAATSSMSVLAQLNRGARIPLCGAISQYNHPEKIQGPKNYLSLLVNRATLQGFIVFDFAQHYGEAAAQMAGWLLGGKLEVAGRHRRRSADVSRDLLEALPRRELRKAADQSGRRMNERGEGGARRAEGSSAIEPPRLLTPRCRRLRVDN